MIKRMAAALCVCLIWAVSAWAQAESITFMKVVNCEQWVSLREKPDVASECLVEVPLGAMVENCSVKNKAFTYAEYNGLTGYIMSQYLEAIPAEQQTLGDMRVADRGAWIPMRSEALNEGTVIAWLAPDVCLQACVDTRNGYVYALFNGIKGYVLLSDLVPAENEM